MRSVESIFKFLSKNVLQLVLIIGILITLIGVLVYYIFPLLINYGIGSRMKIQEGSLMYDNWIETPVPIKTKIYLFHIQNPQQFKDGAKPILKEIGPYVYNQRRRREIISWSANNERVKYLEHRYFYFDRQESVGSLNDRIKVINAPILVILTIINRAIEKFPMASIAKPIVNNIVNIFFTTHSERLIETRTVGEVLNGRRVNLLDTIDVIVKPLRLIGIKIPEYGLSNFKMKNNVYGFVAIRNASVSGPYEIFTGQDDTSSRVMKFVSYRGKSNLDIYPGQSCNMINGSDGTLFGPSVDKTLPVFVYHYEACRSLHANFEHESSIRGISTFRYRFADNLFDGPLMNADNWCFCPPRVDKNKCDGILDLETCLGGGPFAISYPHFLHAPRFEANVIGLNPSREKHLGFLEIEPTLGITLRGSGKFQFNMKVRPISFVPGLDQIRPTLLPYLWIDEGGEINDEIESTLKLIIFPINGIHYGSVSAIIIGLGIVVFSAGALIMNKYNGPGKLFKRREPDNNSLERNSPNKNQIQLDVNEFDEDEMVDNQLHRRPSAPEMEQELTPYGLFPDLLQQLHKELQNKVERMQMIDVLPETTSNKSQEEDYKSEDSFSLKSSLSDYNNKIEIRTSSHSSQSEVTLPPVEEGETHTTIIVQRKPKLDNN